MLLNNITCSIKIRGKSNTAKEKSKFLVLKRTKSNLKPVGLIKGVVHSAEFGERGLVITTEGGDSLELKVFLFFDQSSIC